MAQKGTCERRLMISVNRDFIVAMPIVDIIRTAESTPCHVG